jgi:8-oxo-dGTP pyrophosphatase MutT (NUDIX family)
VYINTFVEAQSKYNMLNIKELLQSNPCKYKDTEWIFPKGRKNTLPRTTLSRVRIEKNLECATREFQEESGFKHGDYKINHSFGTFEESFIGTNNIKYRHIYYIAYVNEDVDLPKIDSKNIHQVGEIKNLGWFTFQECLQNIRSYDVEKKRIIQAVHSHILDR